MAKEVYPFESNYTVPPGSILKEWLEDIGLSQAEFARRCGRSPKLISQIISGDAPIMPETAVQFGRALDCNPKIWSNLESMYRIRLAKKAELANNQRALESLRKVPLTELVRRGLIAKPKTSEQRVDELLKFFGLGSLDAWNTRIAESSAAFRKPEGRELNHEIVEAWLRMGELEANSQQCQEFSKLQFNKALSTIRNLVEKPIVEGCSSIERLCNQAGVAFAVVQPLKRTGVYGAARWLSPNKALIQLSFRGMVDDSAWFSFFHEAGHLLLHSKKLVHLEYHNQSAEDMEREANEFAADMLIAGKQWNAFVANSDFCAGTIKEFARRAGVSPGIVVGRLQYESRIPWRNNLNSLKTKYEWIYEQ